MIYLYLLTAKEAEDEKKQKEDQNSSDQQRQVLQRQPATFHGDTGFGVDRNFQQGMYQNLPINQAFNVANQNLNEVINLPPAMQGNVPFSTVSQGTVVGGQYRGAPPVPPRAPQTRPDGNK